MTAGSALAGLRVLDISRVLAGPSCGQLLADMGADVIKVEPPDGDENRRWPPFVASGASCNFDSVNRGKRNLAVDLKHPNGQRIVHGLADRADVLLLSFLPQTAAKLGLDPAVLTARNPRLVVCEVTGYGAAGPMAERPGYDLMMQAFAGAMSMTGLEGEPPVRTGLSFIDMATGLAAYGAVLTALMARATTGRGTVVRTSLLETGISLLGYHAVAWLAAGVMPKREGSGVWHLVPYQAFRCADEYVLVGAPNEAAWQRLCAALDLPALAADPRFTTNADRVTHRDALIPLLSARFAEREAAHWVARLEAHRVAVSPINRIDQVLTHPQVLANDMVVQAGDARLVGTPFKLAEGGGVAADPPASLGRDADAILRDELGLDDAAIAALRADAVIP
ncbi:MAG: CoA transferase [Rhodospirillales bacterium]|jgi:crotonobetainyl-CoA:carnitine CoA-transferase CaiB-like acyl-CoA transferase|nr:CoA transferase [Rhodospirillales bacterium]